MGFCYYKRAFPAGLWKALGEKRLRMLARNQTSSALEIRFEKPEKSAWQKIPKVISSMSCPRGRRPPRKFSWKKYEKVWKNLKKCLTKENERGNIIRLSARAAKPGEQSANESTNEFEKTWKRCLTKKRRCGKIKARRWKRCAPCKLNNVTNTKHQNELVVKLKRACRDNR